jgi:hypothetical protein
MTKDVGDHLIELLAHRGQTELIQFQMQRSHRCTRASVLSR